MVDNDKTKANFEEPLDSIEEDTLPPLRPVRRSTIKGFAWGALFGIVLTLVFLSFFGFLYYLLEINKW